MVAPGGDGSGVRAVREAHRSLSARGDGGAAAEHARVPGLVHPLDPLLEWTKSWKNSSFIMALQESLHIRYNSKLLKSNQEIYME